MTMTKKLLPAIMLLLVCYSSGAQNFKYFLKKADKEYELKTFNLAVNSYLEALNKKPNSAEALGRLADCYRHLNRMEDAATKYAEAISQRKFDRIYILQFAHVLKALGRYDEAKQWYEAYRQDDPTVSNHFAQTCDYAKTQQSASSGFFVINEETNSSSTDFAPAYYNNRIVFSSASLDLQRSNVNFTGISENQLFVSSVNADGSLQKPDFLKSGFKDIYGQGPVTFSKAGDLVVYTKNNFTDGTRQIPSSGLELSLYIAEVTPNGDWINEVPFNHNGQNFSTGFPHLSDDGSALFFASDRPGGYGGFDLWVSYRNGSSWSNPINLGAVVNTQGNELSPFFDGNQLFFASDWHPGLGGFDIFRAEQQSGRWNKIFHLGVPINSSYDDYGLIFESFQEKGYFTSNRTGGKGAEDIYRVTRNASTSALAIIRVKDASNGAPIPGALLDFSGCNLGTFFADNDGVYKFPLKNANFSCEIVVNKDGYAQGVLPISPNRLNTQPELEVYLNPSSPGITNPNVGLGTQYAGNIIDYSSRQPLPGVLVTALDQSDGTSTQVFTDANGGYSLSLIANKNYFITYVRQGYQEVSKPINTFGGYNPNLLNTITLFPNSTTNPNTNPPVTNPTTNPPITNPTTNPNVGTLQEGYSIQVAALSRDNVSEFSDLANLGNVYSKLESGRYKIRVGVFTTESEAKSTLGLIKNKGHKGAFVVKENGVNLGTKGPNTNPTTNPPITNPIEDPVVGPASSNGYKIQMGAYRNPRYFDASKVQGLGVIEDRQKGNLTLKLLSVYSTLDEAKRILSRVKSAGFQTAFIVFDQNGVLTRIR